MKNSKTDFNKNYTLLIKILNILNLGQSKLDTIPGILSLIKSETNFESVGIRLREGIDFPYYVTLGFPEYFIEAERFLCTYDQHGDPVKDKDGNPLLECMCGNIICGRTDPSFPFFTKFGSFWSNCTTDLLATTSEEDRQSRTRNRCNGEGYESVGLVPLRAKNKTIGLLQLNDYRKNMFTPEMIKMLEEIGSTLGIAYSHNEFRKRIDEVRKLQNNRLNELNCLYSISNIIEKDDITENILQNIIDVIPIVWMDPEGSFEVSVKLRIMELELYSKDFTPYKTKIETKIFIKDNELGSLTVYISNKTGSIDFYDTKRNLLNSISKRISQLLMRKQAEDALKESYEQMEHKVMERTEELSKLNQILKQTINDKEILMRELHHRIKNNMNTIIGFIELQSQRASDESKKMMKEIENRIVSILSVHEVLQNADDFHNVKLADYILQICNNIADSYNSKCQYIQLILNIGDFIIDIHKAVPIGIIINELLTNSYKYAFPENRPGRIDVTLKKNEENYILIIRDNGIGIPEDIDIKNQESLGLKIVRSLASQINGIIKYNTNNGTEFNIDFTSGP